MPTIKSDYKRNIFIKQCAACQRIFDGNSDFDQSVQLLHKYFHWGPPSTYDGLQSYCRECTHDKMRKRNGVVEKPNMEAMHAKQEGKCAICTTPIKLYQGRGRGAHLDHDHKTGVIRGLLCMNCNSALGKFKDSIPTLQSAIQYLQSSLTCP